jgi:hypothetical protein
LTWQTFNDGRKHIKATCAKCGRFLRYLEQTPEHVAQADAAPVPAVQRGMEDLWGVP